MNLTSPSLRIAALLLLASASCSGPQPQPSLEPARDVLLVTVDTLRADTLGFAGDARVRTPTLDRLARQGRVFSFAHAHNVMTLPSHANILTGLYPFQHGVRNNGGFVLPEGLPTMATLLADAGFATGAVIGAYPLHSRYGLARGFETYDEAFDEPLAGSFVYSERPGDEVVRLGREWWSARAGERRFLWLHLFDPHAPYEPPPPFAGRHPRVPYLDEVEATDAYLEPLLAPFLDATEPPALIAFTSDHGEALGEHGEETHGVFAYEGTLRVPLVLWGPGVEPGTDDREARHVDILPTVLESLGLPVPPGLAGVSLLRPPDGDATTYFESLTSNLGLGWAPLRGVLAGSEKLIELPKPELYRLDVDPDEAENLYEPSAARELARRLPEGSEWPPEAASLSPEEVGRLRALGYLASAAPRKEVYTAEDDPKRLIHLRIELNRAVQDHTAGRQRQAIARIERVLEERPATPVAYSYLSSFHLALGDRTSAIRVMRRAVELGLAQPDLESQLGLTLVGEGRIAEALEILTAAANELGDAPTLNNLAIAQVAAGRIEPALATLERAETVEPRYARTYENRSFALLQAERFAEAGAAAEAALALSDDRIDAWNNLGVARFSLGQAAAAQAAFERVVTLDPERPDGYFQLGLAAAEAGDPVRAAEALRTFLARASQGQATRRQVAEQILRELAGG